MSSDPGRAQAGPRTGALPAPDPSTRVTSATPSAGTPSPRRSNRRSKQVVAAGAVATTAAVVGWLAATSAGATGTPRPDDTRIVGSNPSTGEGSARNEPRSDADLGDVGGTRPSTAGPASPGGRPSTSSHGS